MGLSRSSTCGNVKPSAETSRLSQRATTASSRYPASTETTQAGTVVWRVTPSTTRALTAYCWTSHVSIKLRAGGASFYVLKTPTEPFLMVSTFILLMFLLSWSRCSSDKRDSIQNNRTWPVTSGDWNCFFVVWNKVQSCQSVHLVLQQLTNRQRAAVHH